MINKLSLFKGGCCCQFHALAVKGAKWRKIPFPALFAVIQHDTFGNILFDTGYSDHFHQATQCFPQRLYRWATPVTLQENEKAASHLKALQLICDDIDHIILSHFHADHIAGLKDFPNAKIHCHQDGYKQIKVESGLSSVLKGLLKTLLPTDSASRLQFFDKGKLTSLPDWMKPFEFGYDLFSDGSLYAVELPGHAAGHVGLLVNDTNPVFLIADACWDKKAFSEHRPPSKLTHFLMHDVKAYYQTIELLRKLHQYNPELVIIPSHCTTSIDNALQRLT